MHTPRYSRSPITVPYCFHYSQLEQSRKKDALLYLFIYLFKKGLFWESHETCGGGEVLRWPTAIAQRPSLTNVCQSQVQVCSVSAGLRRRPTGRLTVCPHVAWLHCTSIHSWCHLSSSPPTPAVFPGMPSKQIQPGIDFWLCIRIFLCPATSSNLANTNLTSNNRHCGAACQFRCAPLHLGPLWLRLPRSPPLSAYLARSFLHAGLPFHEDYITARFISHTCINTQFNLRSSFYFQTLFGCCL